MLPGFMSIPGRSGSRSTYLSMTHKRTTPTPHRVAGRNGSDADRLNTSGAHIHWFARVLLSILGSLTGGLILFVLACYLILRWQGSSVGLPELLLGY